MFFDGLRGLSDEVRFRIFRQVPLALRISPSMADDFVAARARPVHDLRREFVYRAVGQMAGWKLELVQQVKYTPDADPEPVFPPGVVSGVGRRT